MTDIFPPPFKYRNREEKARYVYEKYQSILDGARILDVGADACFLRYHLPPSSQYVGIGLGGDPDQVVDLEKSGIPMQDNSFDCVLCLDVLEHIENIHDVCRDLFRVARKHVVISLPNPYRDFWDMLRNGPYAADRPMKYYNLPLAKPEDRHKWFFSTDEAKKLISHCSQENNFQVIQIDSEPSYLSPDDDAFLSKSKIGAELFRTGTLWAALKSVGPTE
jgi:SAM-dependent methyltransferase